MMTDSIYKRSACWIVCSKFKIFAVLAVVVDKFFAGSHFTDKPPGIHTPVVISWDGIGRLELFLDCRNRRHYNFMKFRV